MAHYAQINKNNIVTQVVVGGNETETVINWLTENFGETWIQTSYNTKGNVHYGSDGLPDNQEPLRYNYAVVGGYYDPEADAFYAPSPFPSWVLDKTTFTWSAPIPYPEGKNANWNEDSQTWNLFPTPPGPGWLMNKENDTWYKANPLVPDIEEK
jgi:hypothetical protein